MTLDLRIGPRVCCVALAWLALVQPAVAQEPSSKASKLPPIYDPAADAERAIAEAQLRARQLNQRVLLDFGANWCKWCHRLSDVLKSDAKLSEELESWFEVVMVDVDMVGDKRRNAKIVSRYGDPVQFGLPVLVIIGPDGEHLVTQETSVFEEGEQHDPRKVRAFLRKWRATPTNVDTATAEALEKATAQSVPVLLYLRVPGCEACRDMEKFLYSAPVQEVLSQGAVLLTIDLRRMASIKEFLERYFEAGKPACPGFVLADGEGAPIAEVYSDPEEARPMAHRFLDLLREHTELPAERIDELAATLPAPPAEAPADPEPAEAPAEPKSADPPQEQ